MSLTHGAGRDGRFTNTRSDQVFVDGQDFFSDRTLIELLLDVAEGVKVVPFLTAEQATSVIQCKAFSPVRPPAMIRLLALRPSASSEF